MSKIFTLAEAAEMVHQQYLEFRRKEAARFEADAARIRQEEEESAWWVIDRLLETQEGIDRLSKAVSDAQAKLDGLRPP